MESIAPLSRASERPRPPCPDPAATARLAASLTEIEDEHLRDALARLGAAIADE